MLAAGAEVTIRGPGGATRTSSIDDLLAGPFMTRLEPNELITQVRVPDPGPRASGTYLKLERKIGDFATVAVAVQVSLANGTIGRAGIALTGVGPTNMRARAAEEALAGRTPDEDAIKDAARLAAEAAEPRDDVRGSAEFKRSVVRVYAERGLRQAVAEAQAGQEG
jgi:carbon-monoxide dehydrogenase medium subunit